jgi:ATP-dependent Clp protease ATP-binding subunit ClpA
MFQGFTDQAREVMTLAQEEARRSRHPEIGPEHILLGILREGSGAGAAVLTNLGVSFTARASGGRQAACGRPVRGPAAKLAADARGKEGHRVRH